MWVAIGQAQILTGLFSNGFSTVIDIRYKPLTGWL